MMADDPNRRVASLTISVRADTRDALRDALNLACQTVAIGGGSLRANGLEFDLDMTMDLHADDPDFESRRYGHLLPIPARLHEVTSDDQGEPNP